jgi:hypothetical protein
MESELIAFVTNQGLGIGLAAFLVWWVTQQMNMQLKNACDTQLQIVAQMRDITIAMDKIAERLEDHDEQAKAIMIKVDRIEHCIKN